jgi:antitoxin CcdA
MRMQSRIPSGARARRAINISVDPALIEAARDLDVNVSRACERGLVEQIAAARAERWLAENGEAIAASNDHADRHGLPLASVRLF